MNKEKKKYMRNFYLKYRDEKRLKFLREKCKEMMPRFKCVKRIREPTEEYMKEWGEQVKYRKALLEFKEAVYKFCEKVDSFKIK